MLNKSSRNWSHPVYLRLAARQASWSSSDHGYLTHLVILLLINVLNRTRIPTHALWRLRGKHSNQLQAWNSWKLEILDKWVGEIPLSWVLYKELIVTTLYTITNLLLISQPTILLLAVVNTSPVAALTNGLLRVKCAILTSNCWALSVPRRSCLVTSAVVHASFWSSTASSDGFQSHTMTPTICPPLCLLNSRNTSNLKQLKTKSR